MKISHPRGVIQRIIIRGVRLKPLSRHAVYCVFLRKYLAVTALLPVLLIFCSLLDSMLRSISYIDYPGGGGTKYSKYVVKTVRHNLGYASGSGLPLLRSAVCICVCGGVLPHSS